MRWGYFVTKIKGRQTKNKARQISTWLPSSTTRLLGNLKKIIALAALRSIQEKIFSRQIAMPGILDAINV
jgi:hypothetical protein